MFKALINSFKKSNKDKLTTPIANEVEPLVDKDKAAPNDETRKNEELLPTNTEDDTKTSQTTNNTDSEPPTTSTEENKSNKPASVFPSPSVTPGSPDKPLYIVTIAGTVLATGDKGGSR